MLTFSGCKLQSVRAESLEMYTTQPNPSAYFQIRYPTAARLPVIAARRKSALFTTALTTVSLLHAFLLMHKCYQYLNELLNMF